MIDLQLLEEAIALLELQTRKDYDEDFKYGRIHGAKSNYQKLLQIKELRKNLNLTIIEIEL